MTTQQIIAMTCAYSVALAAAIYFTRATSRRVMGALAGGAAVGCMGLGAITLGEALGLWRVPLPSTPGLLALFYLGFVISCSPFYLITWRVAVRFGWRGLAVCLIVAAVIGPPRDYLIAASIRSGWCLRRALLLFLPTLQRMSAWWPLGTPSCGWSPAPRARLEP